MGIFVSSFTYDPVIVEKQHLVLLLSGIAGCVNHDGQVIPSEFPPKLDIFIFRGREALLHQRIPHLGWWRVNLRFCYKSWHDGLRWRDDDSTNHELISRLRKTGKPLLWQNQTIVDKSMGPELRRPRVDRISENGLQQLTNHIQAMSFYTMRQAIHFTRIQEKGYSKSMQL